MEKKRKLSMKYIILVCVIIAMILYLGIRITRQGGDGKKGFEENVGMSYVKTTEFNADQVVPDRLTLISNLEKKGYYVNTNPKIVDPQISREQVASDKGKERCSIIYGLSEEQAEEVFKFYESRYSKDEYYILARNKTYVYCFSSRRAFQDAGFKELATDGRLYINHDNY